MDLVETKVFNGYTFEWRITKFKRNQEMGIYDKEYKQLDSKWYVQDWQGHKIAVGHSANLKNFFNDCKREYEYIENFKFLDDKMTEWLTTIMKKRQLVVRESERDDDGNIVMASDYPRSYSYRVLSMNIDLCQDTILLKLENAEKASIVKASDADMI